MRQAAIVLLGPTGSGKTPLGELVERRGLGAYRCMHFDFGANLRAVVEANRPDAIVSPSDLEFLRGVLHSGALLEDEQFPLAARILRRFLAERAAGPHSLLVLNGLPRHVGQARALAEWVEMLAVVALRCNEEAVLARLAGNVGGDRTLRTDDSLADVRRKLILYDERTAPLVDHYAARGAHIIRLSVDSTTTPEEAFALLAAEWDARLSAAGPAADEQG
jgi:adenylate kinase family enzyme